MEWLAPLKTTLFACKSVSALKEAEAEPDQRPVDGNPADIVAGSGRANLRRRSSLSDLDVLKQKRHALRFSDGAHLTIGDRKSDKLFPGYHSNSRLTECGGSIGDLMNLKHFGSNRSLVSMTSSIADSVPLETVRQRKKTMASSCESNDRCSDPPVASSVTPPLPRMRMLPFYRTTCWSTMMLWPSLAIGAPCPSSIGPNDFRVTFRTARLVAIRCSPKIQLFAER